MIARRCIAAALTVLLGAAAASAADDAPSDAAAPAHHHVIEMRFDPVSRAIAIIDTVTIVGDERLQFSLAEWLSLKKAQRDGRRVRVSRSGALRMIALGSAGTHEVRLELSGKVPALPADRAKFEGAFADMEGAFLPNYAEWIAVSPNERVTYRLEVDVPAPFRAVATGTLEDEHDAGGRHRAVFRATRASESPSVFVGPYEIAERRLATTRIRTYFPADLQPLAPSYLDAAARYLTHFSGLIGDYPETEFHIVAAPVPVGLGFPNLTYIGRRILPLPFIRERSLAHEVLHAWWGNGVVVDYSQGNWSEGLTTYLADYGLAALESAEKAHEMRLGWLRDYAALPSGRDTVLADFQSREHDASQVVGYDKAAYLFHVLRGEIGAEAFARGLRAIWTEHRGGVAGWQDLRRGFEKASGAELGWFFEQWVARPGAPALALKDATSRAADGGHVVEFTLTQSAPAYRLWVPVVIETAAGARKERVRFDKTEQRFRVAVTEPPRSLVIDPDHDLFRRLSPIETPPILRDITLSDRVTALITVRDKAARGIAARLARSLADADVRIRSADATSVPKGAVMVIGSETETQAFLAKSGLPARPEALQGHGTARVWALRRDDTGAPLLVVEAADAAALEALARPLPHYMRQSWIVFTGAKAGARGIWPAAASPLAVRLD